MIGKVELSNTFMPDAWHINLTQIQTNVNRKFVVAWLNERQVFCLTDCSVTYTVVMPADTFQSDKLV